MNQEAGQVDRPRVSAAWLRQACWSCLCSVDVAPLLAWIEAGNARWPAVKGGQPNRVQAPPEAAGIIAAVLAEFEGPVRHGDYYACLSRLIPGRGYEFHRDPQPDDWITRVHVPVITNPDAWFAWEPDSGRRVNFEAGKAYSFNTLVPHAFWNDGTADRIHLTFDVYDGRD